MFRGAALDGLGDDLLGLRGGRFARLGLEALDQVRGVTARVLFDLLDDERFRRLGGQPGDPQKSLLLLLCQFLAASPLLGERLLLLGCALLSLLERDIELLGFAVVFGQLLRFLSKLVLDRFQLLALFPGLSLAVLQQCVRLLFGSEMRFLTQILGVSLRVADQPGCLGLGATNRVRGDSFSGGDPDGEDSGCRDKRGNRGSEDGDVHARPLRNRRPSGRGSAGGGRQPVGDGHPSSGGTARWLAAVSNEPADGDASGGKAKNPALPCGEVG